MKCLLLCQMPLTSDSHQIHTAAPGPMLGKFPSSHHQSALSLWREATCDTSAPRPVCSPAREVKIPLSCTILYALGQKTWKSYINHKLLHKSQIHIKHIFTQGWTLANCMKTCSEAETALGSLQAMALQAIVSGCAGHVPYLRLSK